jgi:hypothetical protein
MLHRMPKRKAVTSIDSKPRRERLKPASATKLSLKLAQNEQNCSKSKKHALGLLPETLRTHDLLLPCVDQNVCYK